MLVLLTPEQVADSWDFIAPWIEESLPPTVAYSREGMVNILRNVLAEDAQVWGFYNDEGENELKAVVLTAPNLDPIIGTINLIVYAVYADERFSFEDWRNGVNTLRTFAASRNCKAILAYSNFSEMAELARRIGGRADYYLLEFSV